jgi:tetratricopeptide (TPR) repeat protein/O-antigen ligase
MKDRIRKGADWLAAREVWVVLCLSPWLLFPAAARPLTVAALVSLPLLWLVRRLAGRPLSARTPLNGPLLLLLLCLGPAVLVSPLPDLSLPQATTFLLGLSLYLAIVNGDQQWRQPELGGGLLTIAGVILALLALVGTNWGPAKIALLGRIAERLPRLILTTTDSAVGGGFHPSEIGGMMAGLLPVVVSFILLSRSRGRRPLMDRWHAFAWGGGIAGLLMLFMLLLTQSRTSLLVLLLVAAVVVGIRWRPVGVVVLALFIVGGILLVIGLFSGTLGDWLTEADAATRSAGTEPNSWSQRVEVWRNALYMLRDYPLAGAGLSAFAPVAWLNYGFDVIAPDYALRNAHNVWLQAGTDLGLVGFVGFSWLTAVLLLLGWAVRRRRRSEERVQLSGIWLGLVVWMGHGALNVISLGARPALVIWMMIGFLVAAWQGDNMAPTMPESAEKRRVRWPILLGVVVLIVLVGILLVGSPLWSLNRGANMLDRVLLSSPVSTEVTGEEAMLSRALSLIESASDLPGALRRRALARYELGDQPQAVLLFRRDEASEGYLVSRGRQLLAEGRLAEAERFLHMALEVAPDSGRLICLTGDVYRLSDSFFDALGFYREVPERAASFGERDIRLAECYYQLAMFERQLGNWSAAAEWFGKAAGLDPAELSYQVEYGLASFRSTGEINQAAAIVESALESDPEDVQAMIVLADMYLQAERPQRSLEWSESAVMAAPSDPEAWLRLAQAYWALEQGDDARGALAEVLRLDPGNGTGLALQAAWESQ